MYKFVAILFVFGCARVCQTSTSGISGMVSDSSGAIVPGAKVVVTNEETGVSLTQVTTQSGVYSFPSLPVGAYTVVVEMEGFRTTRQPGNVLQVESPNHQRRAGDRQRLRRGQRDCIDRGAGNQRRLGGQCRHAKEMSNCR